MGTEVPLIWCVVCALLLPSLAIGFCLIFKHMLFLLLLKSTALPTAQSMGVNNWTYIYFKPGVRSKILKHRFTTPKALGKCIYSIFGRHVGAPDIARAPLHIYIYLYIYQFYFYSFEWCLIRLSYFSISILHNYSLFIFCVQVKLYVWMYFVAKMFDGHWYTMKFYSSS